MLPLLRGNESHDQGQYHEHSTGINPTLQALPIHHKVSLKGGLTYLYSQPNFQNEKHD